MIMGKLKTIFTIGETVEVEFMRGGSQVIGIPAKAAPDMINNFITVIPAKIHSL